MLPLYPAAAMAARALDKSMRTSLPDEIVDAIQTHAVLAVAAAWIPVTRDWTWQLWQPTPGVCIFISIIAQPFFQ